MQHASLTLEVTSVRKLLSKPWSKKATHRNHVYFFPLTSLYSTHIQAEVDMTLTTLTFRTANVKQNTHTQRHNAYENTCSYTYTSLTDNRTMSRGHSPALLLLFLREVECYYMSCSNVEESGPNTTHVIVLNYCRDHRRGYTLTKASTDCC